MSKKSILKIVSTTIHVKLTAWSNRFKHCKAFDKDMSKESMPVAWYSTR